LSGKRSHTDEIDMEGRPTTPVRVRERIAGISRDEDVAPWSRNFQARFQPTDNRRMRSFEDLVAEAADVSVAGWDFSWLNGRATEERPTWGYARSMADRLTHARSALDLQTGGGEVLAEAGEYPPVAVATEAWPSNLAVATARLHPLGVGVVGHDGESALPFADGCFDLVTSRHPVHTDWAEVARVLAPGGTYFSQQVGPASMAELSEAFLGPLPDADRWRRPQDARAAAVRAGLDVVDLRTATLRAEFHDVGAIVYLLRKCVWWVPGFSVERYLDTLHELHQRMTREGPFVAHASRFLLEARRMGR
jgi:SAM-dependent methyltransferase